MYLLFPFRFQTIKLNEENSRPYGRLEFKKSLKNKKEKPRWSDLDFLKLAAARVAKAQSLFFNLSLTQ